MHLATSTHPATISLQGVRADQVHSQTAPKPAQPVRHLCAVEILDMGPTLIVTMMGWGVSPIVGAGEAGVRLHVSGARSPAAELKMNCNKVGAPPTCID